MNKGIQKDKEMDRLKVDGMDAHTIHDKYIDALKENLRLTDELSDLKDDLFEIKYKIRLALWGIK